MELKVINASKEIIVISEKGGHSGFPGTFSLNTTLSTRSRKVFTASHYVSESLENTIFTCDKDFLNWRVFDKIEVSQSDWEPGMQGSKWMDITEDRMVDISLLTSEFYGEKEVSGIVSFYKKGDSEQIKCLPRVIQVAENKVLRKSTTGRIYLMQEDTLKVLSEINL